MPAGRIPLTGAGADRAAHRRRDTAWLAEASARAESQVLLVRPPAGLISVGRPPSLSFLAVGEVADVREHLILLSVDEDGAATFALDADLEAVAGLEAVARLAGDGPDAAQWGDLRAIGAAIDAAAGNLLAQAAGLVHWHRRHSRCGACGEPTTPGEAGYVRSCNACGLEHFPRTDPAVIMLVVSGDRCILGRQPRWPARMFSALAGFVEPGESLEDAVSREVLEEVGIRVGRVRYLASQPWPFPSSLMLGFRAEAATDELRVDMTELAEAAWWERG
ncbi:MAG TPA: NAD(+) diphosphatase, partial [Acidimicrobiales bacterium]